MTAAKAGEIRQPIGGSGFDKSPRVIDRDFEGLRRIYYEGDVSVHGVKSIWTGGVLRHRATIVSDATAKRLRFYVYLFITADPFR